MPVLRIIGRQGSCKRGTGGRGTRFLTVHITLIKTSMQVLSSIVPVTSHSSGITDSRGGEEREHKMKDLARATAMKVIYTSVVKPPLDARVPFPAAGYGLKSAGHSQITDTRSLSGIRRTQVGTPLNARGARSRESQSSHNPRTVCLRPRLDEASHAFLELGPAMKMVAVYASVEILHFSWNLVDEKLRVCARGDPPLGLTILFCRLQ